MIVKDEVTLNRAIALINRSKILSYDIETDGLNVRKNSIIGFGVSNNLNESFYVPKHHTHLKKLLLEIKKSKIPIIAYNSYFDLEFTAREYNVDLWDQLHCDVLVQKHTVDEEFPFGLKDVAKKYLGSDSTKEQKELKESIKANGGSPNEFFKADLDIISKYCQKDCKLTYDLFKLFDKKLKDDNLTDFFYKEEVMPLYKGVTRKLQSKGIPVDVEDLKRKQFEIDKEISTISTEIQEHIKPMLGNFTQWYMKKHYNQSSTGKFAQAAIEVSGVDLPKLKRGKFTTSKKELEKFERNPYIRFLLGKRFLNKPQVEEVQKRMMEKDGIKYPFNLNSKHHLKKLFFEEMKLQPTSKTDLGNPQVNEEFLKHIAPQYQWVQRLIDYNKLNKIKTAYIDRILELQEDGIFYPQFFQHRTVSGRYGSDLQQLPRRGEKGEHTPRILGYINSVRNFFKAPEGYVFIDADYESLEPHVFAHVSNEDKIRDIFRKGHDFYSTIAIETEEIAGASADKKADNFLKKIDPKKRQMAKAYSLGIPYGMESFALSKSLKIPQEKAEMLIQKYLQNFPNLNEWMQKTDYQLKKLGWVKSEAGRMRRFPKAKRLLERYGTTILDSLELWKEYHEDPKKYSEMKSIRKTVKNALNNAKNFQIQSLSASIVNRAAIAINQYLEDEGIDGHICAQIHDEILIICEEGKAQQVSRKMQEIMENIYPLSVSLKAPPEIGRIYGDIK